MQCSTACNECPGSPRARGPGPGTPSRLARDGGRTRSSASLHSLTLVCWPGISLPANRRLLKCSHSLHAMGNCSTVWKVPIQLFLHLIDMGIGCVLPRRRPHRLMGLLGIGYGNMRIFHCPEPSFCGLILSTNLRLWELPPCSSSVSRAKSVRCRAPQKVEPGRPFSLKFLIKNTF
jgi:hypothetical protein